MEAMLLFFTPLCISLLGLVSKLLKYKIILYAKLSFFANSLIVCIFMGGNKK